MDTSTQWRLSRINDYVLLRLSSVLPGDKLKAKMRQCPFLPRLRRADAGKPSSVWPPPHCEECSLRAWGGQVLLGPRPQLPEQHHQEEPRFRSALRPPGPGDSERPRCRFWRRRTWFFPFSIRMLVTFPKGKPRAMTSVSVTSPGSFRIWRTREGAPSILSSPLNFLLSLPLAERHKKIVLILIFLICI